MCYFLADCIFGRPKKFWYEPLCAPRVRIIVILRDGECIRLPRTMSRHIRQWRQANNAENIPYNKYGAENGTLLPCFSHIRQIAPIVDADVNSVLSAGEAALRAGSRWALSRI